MEKWGWYAIFANLAQLDILKMQEVQNLNVHEIHLFLSYSEDKKTVDNIGIKKRGKR